MGVYRLRHLNQASRGIAIAPILFVVGILAVLVAALATSSGGFQGNSANEAARLAASVIIQRGNIAALSFNRLLVSGCDISQISFASSNNTGYANSNAPSDNRCHLYAAEGGNLMWEPQRTDWFDQAQSASPNFGEIIFTGSNGVSFLGLAGSGQVGTEMLMIFPYLTREICIAINNRLGIALNSGEPFDANTATDADIALDKFTGNNGAWNGWSYRAVIDDNRYRRRSQGCFASRRDVFSNTTFPTAYFYYQVLWVR